MQLLTVLRLIIYFIFAFKFIVSFDLWLTFRKESDRFKKNKLLKSLNKSLQFTLLSIFIYSLVRFLLYAYTILFGDISRTNVNIATIIYSIILLAALINLKKVINNIVKVIADINNPK